MSAAGIEEPSSGGLRLLVGVAPGLGIGKINGGGDAMSKSLARVVEALRAGGVDAQAIEMPDETRTAAQAAEAAGCGLDQIVKSILFQGESGRLYLFLTAGGNQVDPARASALAGEAYKLFINLTLLCHVTSEFFHYEFFPYLHTSL